MTRLNKRIREEIIANAVEKSGANNRTKLLKEKRAEWVEKCRVESLGGVHVVSEIETLVSNIQKLMDDFKYRDVLYYPNRYANRCIQRDNCIRVNVAGNATYNRFYDEKGDRINKAIGAKLNLTADHTLTKEWNTHENETKEIDDLIKTVTANVTAMVYSVNTIEKLKEAWPESVELLPSDLSPATSGSNLPAVQIDQLNAMVGLPS